MIEVTPVTNTDLLNKTIKTNIDKEESIGLCKVNCKDSKVTIITLPNGEELGFANSELKNLLAKLYIG